MKATVHDWVVSNPPYLKANAKEWPSLRHEPRLALWAGEDGLLAYRQILQSLQKARAAAPNWRPNLLLEHGNEQQEQLTHLLQENGYLVYERHCDLSQHPRFVVARPSMG